MKLYSPNNKLLSEFKIKRKKPKKKKSPLLHRFGGVIEAEVRAQVLPGGCAPQLVPAYEDGMARLRGTVALVLQKHFSA
jgi:hypothetical protein